MMCLFQARLENNPWTFSSSCLLQLETQFWPSDEVIALVTAKKQASRNLELQNDNMKQNKPLKSWDKYQKEE